MSKKRFELEEIIGKLRHANVLLGQGKKVATPIAFGVLSRVLGSRQFAVAEFIRRP